MPEKRFNAEQIVLLLRQIEVLMSQGKAAPIACREAGISQHVTLAVDDDVTQEGMLRPSRCLRGNSIGIDRGHGWHIARVVPHRFYQREDRGLAFGQRVASTHC